MLGNSRKSLALITGVSMAAIGMAAPALAQDQEQGAVSGEIIVTAQKRDQNLQEVPIAVTAIGGAQLERAGVLDIRALQNVSASFNLNSTGSETGGTTLRIRGVGTTGNNLGLESAVGVFIDGVYVSRPSIALGELLDVKQLEILRGPQGTLFGRNTSAGALTITTKAPSLSVVEAFGNLTFGAIDGGDFGGLVSTQAGVNIPLVTDKLAVRISGAARTRDGVLSSTFDGRDDNTRDRYLIRGQALWAPTADITVRVILDHAESNDNCCDAVTLQETPYVAQGAYLRAGLAGGAGVLASGPSALENRQSNSRQFYDPSKQTGLSAQVDWDLGWGALTYIGSTRSVTTDNYRSESDFNGIEVFTNSGVGTAAAASPARGSNDYVSHELRLAGKTDRLHWMVGGYYATEDLESVATVTLLSDFQRNLNANLFGAFATPGVVTPAGLPTQAAINAFFTAALTPVIGAPAAAATAAGLSVNPAAVLAQGQSSTGAFASNRFTQNGETTSIFTHDTLALTDKLDVTVGLRYVDEKKDGRFAQDAAMNLACGGVNGTGGVLGNPLRTALGTVGRLGVAYLCFPFAVPANYLGAGTLANPVSPALFNKTFNDSELVYTGNVGYQFTPDIHAYASITHGFKSGGFNLDPTAAAGGADPRFSSEKVDSYEVGLKTKLFDGRVRANGAIFRSEMTDFQVLEFTGVQFTTFNVPKAQSTGAEVEVAAALTDHVGATLALTYTDANYPTDCAPATASVNVRTLCGSSLTNAPEWVGIFGLNFDRPVGGNYRLYGDASVRYESDRRTSTQEYIVNTTGPLRTIKTPLDIQEANSKTNLRIGFGSQDEHWGVELWGANVFNEQTRNVTFNLPLRGVEALGTQARGAFIEDPAMYGITIRANY